MAVETIDRGARRVARTAEVQAPAYDLFALVADPHRHGELDGSGTVRATVDGPHRLQQGARFSVRMQQYGLPYRITSRVTAFEDGRLLEWRHPLGHRWRWELDALSPGSTRVTEVFDFSTVPGVQAKALELFRFPGQNAAGIEATLRNLQARYA